MEEGAANTMANLITTVTQVFTAAIGWVGTVGNTIADTPLLLMGCVLGFIGVGVSLFRRMFRM